MSNQLHSPSEALTSIVAFAQMDLDTVNTRDLHRIEAQLDFVLNPERPVAWHQVPPLNRDELKALQRDTLKLLRDLATRGHREVRLDLTFWATRDLKAGAPPDARARRIPGSYEPQVGVLVYGPVGDWLLYRVIRLLEQVGAEKLMVCPDQECGRLFLKVTRKEFCSSRCQSRMYMRAYREQTKREEERHGKKTRTR